jgi:uncharacterized repeat protein (TIGR02543 family)
VENTKAVKTYTSPITIDDKTQLKFYACKMGMNDSAVNEEWYVINTNAENVEHIVQIEALNTYDSTVLTSVKQIVKDQSAVNMDELLEITYDSVELEDLYTDANMKDLYKDTVINKSIVLYAKYVAKQINVTYLDEDGSQIQVGTVSYGQSVDDSVAPEKEGYHFVGWESEDDVDVVTSDITVKAKYIPEEEYATISFGRSKYSIMEGSMFKLTPKVTYQASGTTVKEENIVWSSSDGNIATVDNEGNVTAFAKGEVTISAKVVSSGETAECTISITGNPETSVCLLSNATYQLEDGYIYNIAIGKNHVSEVKKQINGENIRFCDDGNVTLTDDDYVGTNSKIQLLDDNGALLDEVSIILTADYNGDGIINGKDVSGITRCLLNKEEASSVQLRAMDVNGDGYVNNRDASMLARYLVGKEKIK